MLKFLKSLWPTPREAVVVLPLLFVVILLCEGGYWFPGVILSLAVADVTHDWRYYRDTPKRVGMRW